MPNQLTTVDQRSHFAAPTTTVLPSNCSFSVKDLEGLGPRHLLVVDHLLPKEGISRLLSCASVQKFDWVVRTLGSGACGRGRGALHEGGAVRSKTRLALRITLEEAISYPVLLYFFLKY